MARLNKPPTPREAHESSPLLSSPNSIDADAATQQLLTESRASAPIPAPSSAVLGANLLNAARIDHRHSSPVVMGRKTGAGKLKRPSMFAVDARKKLARRGDPYDLEISPEKGGFRLPETVNKEPLRVVRKKRKGAEEEDQIEGHAPPELPRPDEHEVPAQYGEVGELEPVHEADHVNGDRQAQIPSSPPGFAAASRDVVQAESLAKNTLPEKRRPRSTGSTHPAKEYRSTLQPILKRKSESELGDERPHELQKSRTRKTQPQVQIPVRKTTKQKTAKENVVVEESDNTPQGDVADTIEVAVLESAPDDTTSIRQHKPAEAQTTRVSTKASKQARKAPAHSGLVDDEAGNVESDADEREPTADEDEDSEQPVEASASRNIERVFEFLDLEKRSGKCQTKLGTTIKRACKRACFLVREEDTSIEAIVAEFEVIRGVLNQVRGEVPEKDQCAFKRDAYSYIFRTLILFLEVVYTWFDEKCDVVTDSLDAMRILSPLIHEILAFKNTIATWEVSVPQRQKGDRVVKDVDSNLIVPLREVDRVFRVRLSQLEATEHRRKKRAELQRKLKEEAEEERRRTEALIAKRERWRRWQNLHVSRMQCEPDPRRRRKLVITRLDDMEEKDANGIEFERVPVFKTRSTPPVHRALTIDEEREWTDTEETALLEGLQSFAGPGVFEAIFKEYCRPGGELRDFTVADIVAKTAWVRSAWLKLHQEKGWEVPDWVKKIPALP